MHSIVNAAAEDETMRAHVSRLRPFGPLPYTPTGPSAGSSRSPSVERMHAGAPQITFAFDPGENRCADFGDMERAAVDDLDPPTWVGSIPGAPPTPAHRCA